jgi:NitT/TauT family transport system ATP-binding protein/sulfonate transport system ATP-binding protein
MSHPRNRNGVDYVELRKKLLEKFHLASEVKEPEYTI